MTMPLSVVQAALVAASIMTKTSVLPAPRTPKCRREFTGMIRPCLVSARIIGERLSREIELLGDEGHQFFRKSCGAVEDLRHCHGGVAHSASWRAAPRRLRSSRRSLRLEQAGAIKVFTDVKSGKSMARPGLTELLAYARPDDTLAIVRFDRLGRSLAELLATVSMLRERQIDLLSLEEKIDTSTAAGELVFYVFGAIAHFERRLISERTKDGMAAARVKGRQPGRQPLDMKKVEPPSS